MTFAFLSQWAIMISPAWMIAKENIRQTSSSWLEHWTDWTPRPNPSHALRRKWDPGMLAEVLQGYRPLCLLSSSCGAHKKWLETRRKTGLEKKAQPQQRRKRKMSSPHWVGPPGSLRGRGSSSLNQPVIRATKKRTDKIRRIWLSN